MTHSIKEDRKPAKKRRAPPPQFAGQVKELGDVLSSVSAIPTGSKLNPLAGGLRTPAKIHSRAGFRTLIHALKIINN